ncbi:M48 family metallopeptidase [Methanoculleus sp. FWC-SCC1]|uniref:M48 family metallopeptidase n=1 Tax=Methanoculleus frigidifontis TaxID=2584085 RepID=A0ABT8MDP3_9EURY|nr:SprT family zinc-dependent metalloprotease [Methanoculleus sp. FWC-SCC1]MDN7026070.1 M48 family metallopeptidase [Methanoculleus sp. FWC-SCC1]
MKWIDADGTAVPVTVVRKPVKTARLQVRPDGTIRIVAPRSFPIDAFLARNTAWITQRRRDLARLAEAGDGNEDRLLLCGEYYRLVEGKPFGVDEEEGTVTAPSLTVLKRNLIAMLRREIAADAALHPALAERAPPEVTVRMQQTKWGSCSSLGNLNFNLRVIALPVSLREYIVVHELAHLREHNHSRAFWEVVHRHYPDYRSAEAELRRYWVLLERNRLWKALREA